MAKRMVGRQRLDRVRHVQSSRKASALKLFDQRLEIDEAAARDVDQTGAIGEQRQTPTVEQIARLLGQAGGQDDDGGGSEQLVELEQARVRLPGAVGGAIRIVRHQIDLERRDELRERSPDAAQADEPDASTAKRLAFDGEAIIRRGAL